MKDIIDRIYEDHKELKKFLEDHDEISLSISADEIYRKTLLLAISSYFEDRITSCVLEYVKEQTHEKHIISELVRTKFISRQYHTWFRWDDKNINSFLGIFGEPFKKYATEKIKDEELEESIKQFLELGLDRNRLVHQNFAAFSLEKTSDELYSSYKEAIKIIDRLPKLFREFNHI
ncbi:TPA: HEPN domain-containing protein [Neisseria oralis]|jgi:alr4230 protein|uniref:HEPN domain-containing protein n=1 Tax=Neisseria oralis TaxID=1107316 RepID=A0ABW8Q4I6_9NEIS